MSAAVPSAGGIAITLGFLLVLPVVLSVFASLTNAQWILDVANLLPSQAGGQLFTYSPPGVPAAAQTGLVLNGWGGFGVLAAEVVAVGALAVVVARTRDV